MRRSLTRGKSFLSDERERGREASLSGGNLPGMYMPACLISFLPISEEKAYIAQRRRGISASYINISYMRGEERGYKWGNVCVIAFQRNSAISISPHLLFSCLINEENREEEGRESILDPLCLKENTIYIMKMKAEERNLHGSSIYISNEIYNTSQWEETIEREQISFYFLSVSNLSQEIRNGREEIYMKRREII